MEATLKQLKIQTSAVKRLLKEAAHYEKEAADHERKLQSMKEAQVDEYDIRAQERLLEESMMMIPDSKRRLEAAVTELQELIDGHEDNEAFAEKIAEARAVLPSEQDLNLEETQEIAS